MKMPNYKPTKWKLYRCAECKINDTSKRHWCISSGHTIQEMENIPFFVPDMEFEWVGQKWSKLNSKVMNKGFMLSASRLEKIIRGCGIQPGGKIPNKWWMYSKVGGSLSIILIEDQ